jgi:hypothetical protein
MLQGVFAEHTFGHPAFTSPAGHKTSLWPKKDQNDDRNNRRRHKR